LQRASRFLVTIAVGTLVLAGCGRREGPPAPPRPVPVPTTPKVVDRPLITTSYVATSASMDLYNIRAGELAGQRSTNGRVRAYAAKLVEDHRGTAAQLSFAGRRLNLLPAADMAPPHRAMFDELAAASDFDSTFIRQQRSLHQQAARMHAAFAISGDSPTLRPVAANAAGVEHDHIYQLGGL